MNHSPGEDGVHRYQGRFYVLDVDDLRRQIFEEANGSLHSIHPDPTKMYSNLQEIYCLEWFEEGYIRVFV